MFVLFIIKLLRMICGCVYFNATGGFSERFINLCALKRINIRDVKINENGIFAVTAPKNYIKLHSVARSSGMKLRATRKSGLPFFLKKNRDRVGLLIGGVFFVLFMITTSMFIWNVETYGSEKMNSELIVEQMATLGLKPGVLKRKTMPHEISRDAMIKLSGKASWLSVNLSGTKATVEIRDYEKRRDDLTYTQPCNIVSDIDGMVLTVEVHNGKKVVSEGSGIYKGDLLISGIVENRDTSTQFMEARGTVTALHIDKMSIKQNRSCSFKTYIKSKSIYKIYFLGINVPFGFFSKETGDFEEFEENKYLCYNNVKLPFSLRKITRAYFEETTDETDNSEIMLFDEYTISSYDKYKNTTVLNSEAKIISRENTFIIETQTKCIDFIGKKQRISFE